MEPAQVEVKSSVIIHSSVIDSGFEPEDGWWFFLKNFPVKFWLRDNPNLRPGDRVKITITKEPDDAKPLSTPFQSAG